MNGAFIASLAEAGEPAHGPIAGAVGVAVGLVAIASTIGVLTKFIRVPYTIALVLCGLGIALLGWAPGGVRITEDLVLLLFLPPLLFQAGLHLRLDLLRKAWAPVLVLALPGVVVTSLAVAAAVKPILVRELGPDVATWSVALLLGIVMAPTDPISVMATFRTAGVDDKLKSVVEGESLFNDGTAVALFAVLKGAVFVGAVAGIAGQGEQAGGSPAGAIDAVQVCTTFLQAVGIGAGLGLGLGLAAFWLLKHLDDHTLETAITIALAWGSFVLAEHLHGSGVIAVVVAGLIMGNYGKVLSMSQRTRTTLTGFWDSIDFVVNSVLFLLIGIELSDPHGVGGVGRLLDPNVLLAAGVVVAALLVARAAVVYPVCLVLKPYWPRGWRHVIWWAGLRGSLSLALILGLPAGPIKSLFVAVAFVVVLVSLLGQGLVMPIVIRLVGAGGRDAEAET